MSNDSGNYEALYESFMSAVQKAEEAATPALQQKWVKTAREEYAEMLESAAHYSPAKLRRAKRALEALDDLPTA